MTRWANLTVLQGTTWRSPAFPVLFSGEGVDLLSATVRAQARLNYESGTVLHEWSTNDGTIEIVEVTTTNSEGDVVVTHAVVLKVSAAASTAWAWCRAVYDTEVTMASGNVYRILSGGVRVSPEVTRDE